MTPDADQMEVGAIGSLVATVLGTAQQARDQGISIHRFDRSAWRAEPESV